MSAPILWIGLPAATAIILFLFRNFPRVVLVLGILISAFLWAAALLLPIEQVVNIGSTAFRIGESFNILGRQFILRDVDRAYLAMAFFFELVWVIGAGFAKANKEFIPFSFLVVGLLIAALAVEPFLYAALLIEITILIAIPLLSPPLQQPGKGVFRFLTFQSLGMPFILLAGWFLAGLEASPGQTSLVIRSGALLGIGFVFLLAIVPFHSWIPSLTEESPPFTTGFILFMLPAMVFIFSLGFIDRFFWLRESAELFLALRIIGTIMIVIGGLWAAVETHLGRMFGHAVVLETGASLLAIGVGNPAGILLFFWLLVVRVFSYVLWAIALEQIKSKTGDKFDAVQLAGEGHQHPLLYGMLFISQLSLAGLPLLAGFSARFALWNQIAKISPLLAGIALIGNIGLLAGIIRTFLHLFAPLSKTPNIDSTGGIRTSEGLLISERLLEWIMYGGVIVFISLIGLVPHIYLPWLERLLQIFEQIGS